MLLKVGLTGGIASGKSIVLKLLKALGCHTIDADDIVHALYRPESETYRKLAEVFSRDILDSLGRIDRKKLGKIIFSDVEKRKCLNEIVHPAVLDEVKKRLEEYSLRVQDGIAVVDAALLIESGSFVRYDKIIVVVAHREIRLKRLMMRDVSEREEALRKIEAQMPDVEKRKFSDYVIENSGTRQELEKQTRDVHACLIRDKQDARGYHV